MFITLSDEISAAHTIRKTENNEIQIESGI